MRSSSTPWLYLLVAWRRIFNGILLDLSFFILGTTIESISLKIIIFYIYICNIDGLHSNLYRWFWGNMILQNLHWLFYLFDAYETHVVVMLVFFYWLFRADLACKIIGPQTFSKDVFPCSHSLVYNIEAIMWRCSWYSKTLNYTPAGSLCRLSMRHSWPGSVVNFAGRCPWSCLTSVIHRSWLPLYCLHNQFVSSGALERLLHILILRSHTDASGPVLYGYVAIKTLEDSKFLHYSLVQN